MKKLFLLLASGSIALSGVAQMRTMTFDQPERSRVWTRDQMPAMHTPTTAAKSTAGGGRWYSYWDYMNQMLTATLSQQMNNTAFPIWSDTVHKVNYSTGAQHITMMSIGTIFDPSSVGFNDNAYYSGAMKVGPSDAYVVDSVTIFGTYTANTATTSIKDTIRLSFVKGFGGAASSDDIFGGGLAGGGHYGAATFVSMRHDSLRNAARSGTVAVGSLSTQVMDIILDNTTYADTNANGIWIKTVPTKIGSTVTPISVSANGMVGMSISYFSGEPLSSNPAETVVYDAVTQNATHNIFMPLIGYAADASDNVQWAPYFAAPDPKADSNVGLFKKLPGVNGWAGQYIPTWAWSTSTGASVLQFPNVNFHVTCTTCGVVGPITIGVANVVKINSVNAYPNPADNELNIPFTLTNASDVTISLSNMLGQVVATKTMSNVASGTATFNTAALSSGLYTYSVNANGTRTSGRISITH